MRGAIPPFPQYAFKAWCSVKAQRQLYFKYMYFYFIFYMYYYYFWSHNKCITRNTISMREDTQFVEKKQ